MPVAITSPGRTCQRHIYMTAARDDGLWRSCNSRRSVYRIASLRAERLAGELREASAEVEQRTTFAHCAALHFGDEDRVIACRAMMHELTLEVSHCIIEQHHTAFAPAECHAVEASRLSLVGKSTAVRLVLRGHDIDAELRMIEQEGMHRRRLVDTHEHERRREAHRAERAHGHAQVALSVSCGDDRDPGRKATQELAKSLGINHGLILECYAVLPASTVSVVPVMFFAWSLSRNATAFATSSISAIRRSALRRAIFSR